MKTTEEMIEVMTHYVNGGEVEMQYADGSWRLNNKPQWEWWSIDYRIKQADPYAELKAAAADPTKQIRDKVAQTAWVDGGKPDEWLWQLPPSHYETREKPWKKKITVLAWFTGERLTWMSEDYSPLEQWKRVPMQDKLIEVEA